MPVPTKENSKSNRSLLELKFQLSVKSFMIINFLKKIIFSIFF